MSRTEAARAAIARHKSQAGKPKPPRPRPPLPPGVMPAGARDRKFAKKPRLPDGATYVSRWSAERGLWEAALVVPKKPVDTLVLLKVATETTDATVIQSEFGALFQLLEQVDKRYRAAT